MKIYLSSRYARREELVEYRRQLQDLGHIVQARWLNGDHQYDQFSNEGFAVEDLEDVIAAELCISFTEGPRYKANRGGRHVEYGIALANKARVMVVGYRENIFHWLPFVEFYPTWEEALSTLKTCS